MKIWLDDIRTPPDWSWKWLKTAEDAIDWFRLNHDVWDVEILSLDNDLGEGLDDGYKGYKVQYTTADSHHRS